QGPEPASAAAPPAIPNGDRQRVLVVDDNATSRDILQRLLASLGLRAAAADGGSAALAELQRAAEAGEPYTLALIDAGMPGMDGFTLCTQISRTGARPASILMLSAHD